MKLRDEFNKTQGKKWLVPWDDKKEIEYQAAYIRFLETKLKQLDKPVVMQGCQCKDRIGETKVWCCNQCGLPCEDGWLPTHKAIRQPTIASSAVGSQTSARTCANGCDWPNCTLEGCVDPKCDC